MCLQLLQECSFFFNTILAFVDGLRGDSLALASSFYPSDAAFYDAVRFPCVLRVLFKMQNRGAGLELRSVRNHFSGVTLKGRHDRDSCGAVLHGSAPHPHGVLRPVFQTCCGRCDRTSRSIHGLSTSIRSGLALSHLFPLQYDGGL